MPGQTEEPQVKRRSHESERRCIVSGEIQPKRALIRFVVDPSGNVVPDLAGKLPGRGMYVSGDRDILLRAVEKQAFSRAVKMKVQATPELVDRTQALVRKKVLDLLGLARRAGALVTGFEQVRKASLSGVDVLITARDAADDGAKKIRAKTDGNVPRVLAFDRDELSVALGAPNVVHAAVVGSSSFRAEAVRKLKIAVDWLNGLTPDGPATAQDGAEPDVE